MWVEFVLQKYRILRQFLKESSFRLKEGRGTVLKVKMERPIMI